ncbi:hypothetical protein [Fodinicola feengrottensis]|uniref:hypothetical protein n=1 Tax=Fodinicola feengrottensis TaxID=435914 RepID=UPI0013D2BD98|nr:hypothetical protein [Fodinicola feengrottensis]
MRYDHALSGPLSPDGMLALFDVAIVEPVSEPSRQRHYEHWCIELQQRAASLGIRWTPAAGVAAVFTRMTPDRLTDILLRIIETTPVFPLPTGTDPLPSPGGLAALGEARLTPPHTGLSRAARQPFTRGLSGQVRVARTAAPGSAPA